jgi:predicted amidohydrolase YtcJ
MMKTTRIENATIWTGHRLPDGSWFESDALLMRGGRILALGATALRADADEVVDGRGGFVTAGFADGHAHPIPGGLEEQFAPVRMGTSPQEIVRIVGEWARANPEVEWVRGEGFDHTTAPDGVFFASWLDAEVPDRPVVLRATDYHTVWVNSEALRRVGYVAGLTQPDRGLIVLDDHGAPTGTLREWGAWRPVYDLLPAVAQESINTAVSFATQSFATSGLTWVQDAWVEPDIVEAWLASYSAGAVTIAVDLAQLAEPGKWSQQLEMLVELRDRVNATGGGLLTSHTVKFFADGVFESGTSAMLEPYCDCPHRGLPNWDAEEMKIAVAAFDARGFTPHIHGIGDLGVRMALDSIEHAALVNSPRDRRWVTAHTQLVDPSDVNRFAELGVIANFEPYWHKYDDWQVLLTAPRLGEERTNRQFQPRTLAAHGAKLSFGSDWPVTTHSPLEGIQVAVTRQMEPDGPPWMPEERMSVEESLAAYTSGVAFQAGRDDAGTLRPGAIADVAWMAQDPRRVDPMDIGSIEILGTIHAGEMIYRSESLG